MVEIAFDRSRRSGEPLIAFVLVLLVWLSVRILAWHSPFPERGVQAYGPPDAQRGLIAEGNAVPPLPLDRGLDGWRATVGRLRDSPTKGSPAVWPLRSAESYGPVVHGERQGWTAAYQALAERDVARDTSISERASKPAAYRRQRANAEVSQFRSDRWSLDGWVFLREGSGQRAVAGPLQPSYGSSQAGMIARYRLAPASRHRPDIFLRATSALGGQSQADLAIGLSARPFPAIPVRAHAEMRASRFTGTTELRPAAFLVTELPPIELPLAIRAESYVQAGYVGGDFATAFADGQMRAERRLTDIAGAPVRTGAGAWGGVQKGAGRFDVGPTIRTDIAVGEVPLRLSLDYRKRVAGDASPPSGLALTVSTGF